MIRSFLIFVFSTILITTTNAQFLDTSYSFNGNPLVSAGIAISEGNDYVLAGVIYQGSYVRQSGIFKINQSGNILWSTSIPSSLTNQTYSDLTRSFIRTSDSNYVVCGISEHYPCTPCSSGIFIASVNYKGDTNYIKRLNAIHIDEGFTVVEDQAGGVTALGKYDWYEDPFTFRSSLVLSRFSKVGVLLDTIRIPIAPGIVRGGKLISLKNGMYIIATTVSVGDTLTIRVMKIDNSGHELWAQNVYSFIRLGGSLTTGYVANIKMVNEDTYVLAGFNDSSSFFTCYDTLGNRLWIRQFPLKIGDMQIIPGGRYLLAGDILGKISVFKTDSMGIEIDRIVFNGGDYGMPISIVPLSNDSFIFTGNCSLNNNYALFVIKSSFSSSLHPFKLQSPLPLIMKITNSEFFNIRGQRIPQCQNTRTSGILLVRPVSPSALLSKPILVIQK
jgi:hypothetical protein